MPSTLQDLAGGADSIWNDTGHRHRGQSAGPEGSFTNN